MHAQVYARPGVYIRARNASRVVTVQRQRATCVASGSTCSESQTDATVSCEASAQGWEAARVGKRIRAVQSWERGRESQIRVRHAGSLGSGIGDGRWGGRGRSAGETHAHVLRTYEPRTHAPRPHAPRRQRTTSSTRGMFASRGLKPDRAARGTMDAGGCQGGRLRLRTAGVAQRRRPWPMRAVDSPDSSRPLHRAGASSPVSPGRWVTTHGTRCMPGRCGTRGATLQV